mgnify:CR=1 FL=1
MSVPSLKDLLRDHALAGPTGWANEVACKCGHLCHKLIAARSHYTHVADVIQDAHTIRTVEDLNALPVRAIVRDANGFVFEYAPDGEGGVVWWYDGDPEDASDVELPALVLWCPADEAEVQQ